MIRYTLKCDAGHSFESWFKSADAYEALSAEGLVSCAVCGSGRVEKALMTPQLRPQGAATEAPLAPKTEVEEALAAMRREIEANSDYVGLNFAAEARAMHSGAAPERAIHGEARLEDAKKLIEDGIPVAPLPFRSRRRAN